MRLAFHMDALAKYVMTKEFPWEDTLDVRQWMKIEQHGFFNQFGK